MLSSRILAGPSDADELVASGETVQWIMANDGTVAWPPGTTLRLVGGPVAMCPIVELPVVAPGQTVNIDLEVQPTKEPAKVYYSLVSPDCKPFGEIAGAALAPSRPEPAPAPQALMVLFASSMDGAEGGCLEAAQDELKTVEWTLGNLGRVTWPNDVSANLVYNTPGFKHLPAYIKIPAAEPGMTVQAGITALMPEREGHWKAIWAVTSPSQPGFGEMLVAEFKVSDFPFADWLLADEATADSFSDCSGCPPTPMAEPKPFSVAMAMQQHLFQEGAGEVEYLEAGAADEGFEHLGQVFGVAPGTTWRLELALSNDGTEPWPADAALACCFGTGFGCSWLQLGAVEAGQTIIVQSELLAPEGPSRSAWAVSSEKGCFGPVFMLDVA